MKRTLTVLMAVVFVMAAFVVFAEPQTGTPATKPAAAAVKATEPAKAPTEVAKAKATETTAPATVKPADVAKKAIPDACKNLAGEALEKCVKELETVKK